MEVKIGIRAQGKALYLGSIFIELETASLEFSRHYLFRVSIIFQ